MYPFGVTKQNSMLVCDGLVSHDFKTPSQISFKHSETNFRSIAVRVLFCFSMRNSVVFPPILKGGCKVLSGRVEDCFSTACYRFRVSLQICESYRIKF